jgi:hypothetical protein
MPILPASSCLAGSQEEYQDVEKAGMAATVGERPSIEIVSPS